MLLIREAAEVGFMTKLSNVQHSHGYGNQSLAFREHRIAEYGRECLGFVRMQGEVGSAVMEAGEQATEDNLPTSPPEFYGLSQ